MWKQIGGLWYRPLEAHMGTSNTTHMPTNWNHCNDIVSLLSSGVGEYKHCGAFTNELCMTAWLELQNLTNINTLKL
jgi:hypothetical protein